ncbi:MAG: hypothetical protein IRZ33_03310 [Alicyclobacillaceae bacterium]|nr:hypothetical protein [Alicyclobacillaceae bacterium]
MTRWCLYSYLALAAASVAVPVPPTVQAGLSCGWWVGVLVLGWTHPARAGAFTRAQAPGMALAVLSVITAGSPAWTEWTSGLVSVWVHPFMPLLARIPPGHVGGWSNVYVAACAWPFVLTAATGLLWRFAEAVGRWPRPRVDTVEAAPGAARLAGDAEPDG